ncbi:MAG: hypothetical protein MI919_26085, partial [Holophagales bacterium]|nr:hypothetical protein [Holophagales bacterium]
MSEPSPSTSTLTPDTLRPRGAGALPWVALSGLVTLVFLLELSLGVVWIPLRDVFSLLLRSEE